MDADKISATTHNDTSVNAFVNNDSMNNHFDSYSDTSEPSEVEPSDVPASDEEAGSDNDLARHDADGVTWSNLARHLAEGVPKINSFQWGTVWWPHVPSRAESLLAPYDDYDIGFTHTTPREALQAYGRQPTSIIVPWAPTRPPSMRSEALLRWLRLQDASNAHHSERSGHFGHSGSASPASPLWKVIFSVTNPRSFEALRMLGVDTVTIPLPIHPMTSERHFGRTFDSMVGYAVMLALLALDYGFKVSVTLIGPLDRAWSGNGAETSLASVMRVRDVGVTHWYIWPTPTPLVTFAVDALITLGGLIPLNRTMIATDTPTLAVAGCRLGCRGFVPLKSRAHNAAFSWMHRMANHEMNRPW